MFSASKSSAPAVSGGLLSKSLRFRSSASAYFNRTPATAGNRRTWTWSGWVKRGVFGNDEALFSGGTSDPIATIRFSGEDPASPDGIRVFQYASGFQFDLTTTAQYRDPSAWYHIVVGCDTTQATASNRLKLYVNGVQVTAFDTATYPSLNYDTSISNNVLQNVGRNGSGSNYFSGYMADVYFIDGQQLTPSSFGATDATTGQWSPAKYTGTYGTNGFHLTFANATSTTTLGYDTSGNSNNWTTNNFSLTAGSTYDSMNDVPVAYSATAANYCVWGLANKNVTLSNGNLAGTTTSGMVVGTIGVSSGKWYWECIPTDTTTQQLFGIISVFNTSLPNYVGGSADSYGYYATSGNKYNNSSSSAYGSNYTNNDVIGVALDLNAGTLTFYKNNTSQGVAFTGLSGTFAPAAGDGATNAWVANFGQQPFVYTPPSGYLALNTYNLSAPTIAQGNKYMDASLYTGTLVAQSITNAGSFQPDWVWIKSRSAATDHKLTDSVRGVTKALISDTTAAETTDTLGLTAFNSNGFTISTDTNYNNSGATYVAWQWKASNATAVTNTSGSLTSSVSANTTSGFSVVSWTSNGAASVETMGHGLGVAPSMIIVKNKTAVSNWVTYHTSLGNNQYISLNTTGAANSFTPFWSTSSTTFGIRQSSPASNGDVCIAYCFTPIAGYSAFGSYTGNGSADGTFVFTGFRPAFVMIKRYDSGSSADWQILDTARDVTNVAGYLLQPNATNAESNATPVLDFLSNGFKNRNVYNVTNASGGTYIYMAFAENPFKYANAR